ncbi:class I SAM-dependent methyltransferase [Flavobacterium sp. Fl-318]|jgi:SAM-dependent methyltransferase|uniref:Class I SAM-dependent methyltransferase n=1 Tax=Flavobacterium cupriresistens TaxID=2893885 RepID=A0ABU4R8C2_9FLAO|nr:MULTISPECIES: class I SAM-dependent methyltransferase [unclassified Flavobacterium]MDX6188486.1 class I SAM-dependent methyltransferase [Flavobacterium sp. Fl-318]UFH44843.1 class I SAM-dependent methyltransferase [Flavobacterium sp. F-323]
MNLRSVYYTISPKSRLLVRKIYYFPIDFFDLLRGRKNKFVPNKGDIFIGSGDFVAQGKHHLMLLEQLASLQSNHAVLDIGCGIGRAAVPLTQFLKNEAKYEGFDVVKKGILWCKKNITKDFPNFNFQYIPLNNDLYYLTSQKAENFVFPYRDHSFDTVFLFSVFTHMQPVEVQNYLNEISRVLKPGGKCLSTFFIYNDEIETAISKQNSAFNFPYKEEGYRLMNQKVPSANIAFEEEYLLNMITQSNLKLKKKIYGSWANRQNKNLFDYQDILILEK